ncbi:M81 family metallopeptidase [Lacisediminihabitans changchengi]|uniref:M81 family metallopeptidase n=1 Tax=Lacisediminihabitans changchengi TaxID=2787634 RepID=A0A934SIV3_9MICO|nr:M81 family metallopeptidase [Lacisediminihabitans changchengi]MBK4346076.1 M81 family metallopeptidase [Lacisediminihabitans changchengi]
MTSAQHPAIAIAGLAIESSTFSPARTTTAAFHPKRGAEVMEKYAFLAPGMPLRESATWLPALTGKAIPGGIVTREAFEQLSQEIVTSVRDMLPLDGLYFDIHGAMSVEGIDDAEAVLLRLIRDAIGPDVVVSASLDLHGNVSRELVELVDLITCYRTAPHEDEDETRERAVRNLVEQLSADGAKPIKAWIPLPILLPGEKTSTRLEPAAGLYELVAEVESRSGIIDAAVWVGYAWADEPRSGAAVVVTGDDRAAVTVGAQELATAFWEARDRFPFVAPTDSFANALDTAFASRELPFFVSDSGDNPTAGGAGDVTWGLTELLRRPELAAPDAPQVIYASVPAPTIVAEAVRAGVGAMITATGGADVDARHAGPLTVSGLVHSIRHGDRDALTEVVLQIGSVFAVFTELRKPYHYEHDFTRLGLSPRKMHVVIVKIGYLEPELFDMADGWVLALTPGGVDQDIERLGHRRITRPMFPLDPTMATPDLTARIVPSLDGGERRK